MSLVQATAERLWQLPHMRRLTTALYDAYLSAADALVHRGRLPGALGTFKAPPPLPPDCPIDAVYTFVDMTDASWQRRWRSVEQGPPKDPIRYSNRGELEFSVATLRTFCPWIRRIYIVTPTPDSVPVRGDDITIIADDDIIGPECVKPTFKSCSIESYLHTIPGLSECFLYLCDDMFVGRPIDRNLIIGSEGLMRVGLVRRNMAPWVMNRTRLRARPWERDIQNAARCVADKFGVRLNLGYSHHFTVVSRSACELTWTLFADALNRSVAHRTREPGEDTIHFVLLSQLVGILTRRMRLSFDRTITSRFWEGQTRAQTVRAMDAILRDRPHGFCLNNIREETSDLLDVMRRRYFRRGSARRVFYVCSFGGCGSTMLSRFLRRYGDSFHVHSRRPPARLTTIARTPHHPHALEWFSDEPVDDVDRHTVIFLFRHPTYAQLASTGATGAPVYNEVHRENIQVDEDLPSDIAGYAKACRTKGRELLGYAEFFDNYVGKRFNQDYDIVCVDYDRLWDHVEEFLFFAGLDVRQAFWFPRRKRRMRRYNESLVRDLNAINAPLIDRIGQMPAVSCVKRAGTDSKAVQPSKEWS